MKKYVIKLLALFTVLIVSMGVIFSYASEECSWYIKRKGKDLPSFPDNAPIISQYNVYYVDKSAHKNGKKIIYLTFDAGYENGNIAKILDILKEKNVPAAFFLLDNIIIKNTDLVKRMTKEGHLVCNHTKRHKNLSFATKEEIKRDLSALEEVYEQATGEKMSKYFRFPEGKYSIDAIQSIDELGYKTVFWSFGYDDWDNNRQPDKEKSKKKIIENTHDGEVFLFHPTSKTNAEILAELIDSWCEMGYSFGTLDDLCS